MGVSFEIAVEVRKSDRTPDVKMLVKRSVT